MRPTKIERVVDGLRFAIEPDQLNNTHWAIGGEYNELRIEVRPIGETDRWKDNQGWQYYEIETVEWAS